MKAPLVMLVAVMMVACLSIHVRAASATAPAKAFGPGSAAAASSARAAVPGDDLPQIAVPNPLPAEYRQTFEQSRSMFSKGLPVMAGPGNFVPSPTPPSVPAPSPAPAIESHLVFNGVVVENGVALAFVEDTNTFVVARLKVGDAIGRGTVRDISFSSLAYASGGRVRVVALGQNLLGQPTGRSSSGPMITTTRPDLPGNGDILERMIQRRVDELKTMQ